eukprot:Polyplicarium_translucidae@DN2414_c0_g1_i1.p1
MSVTLKTSLGDLKIELYCLEAPKTCKNFLALCASGYYTRTKFHRNIKGFAIQGGDPTGTGKGGESVYGEPFGDEFHPALRHDKKGVVSMANRGADTNTSNFFITYSRQPHLNGRYTVFGRVIDGLDTLEKMEREPVDLKHRLLRDLVIEDVLVHANPVAEVEAATEIESESSLNFDARCSD